MQTHTKPQKKTPAFRFDDDDQPEDQSPELSPSPVKPPPIPFIVCDLVSTLKPSLDDQQKPQSVTSLLEIQDPEIVHGKVDDRKRVGHSQLKKFPYNVICKLFVTFGTKTYFGTGWLIDSETLVTAGHCVFYNRTWASAVTVVPAMEGREMPHGVFYATKLVTTKEWATKHRSELDIGLVKLDRQVTHASRFFDLASKPSHINHEDEVVVCGYPGELHDGQFLFQDRGTVLDSLDNRLFYNIDTSKGQSGGPIFNNVEDVVIGVHNYGGKVLNSGTSASPLVNLVESLNGHPRLEFELDENGLFLSYKNYSKSFYLPPKKFLGAPLATALPGGEKLWVQTRQAVQDSGTGSFNYSLDDQRFEAQVRKVRKPSLGGTSSRLVFEVTVISSAEK